MDSGLGWFAGATGIFGGSFNPPHHAHWRMAIEAREQAGLARVDFYPVAVPPHKAGRSMLPFALRLVLAEAMIATHPGYAVSALEDEVDGPSYSYETLVRVRQACPQEHFVFIVGSTDFLTLPAWHRGLELPLITDMIVVERAGVDEAQSRAFAHQHWGAKECASQVLQIPGGGRIALLTMPRLDISASLVRAKFVQGFDIRGLVPEAVHAWMQANRATCLEYWTS
ncbi:MAG: nicotinate (nicotinamide) nucleotide adenylyltransferase [Desulfovibrionales bacterium]|nr:nicotinate (nicotinamide) nucleotide adenylyltransferase [Desulfovibrionales bacterium]